jgi:hypothetical protein
MSHHEDMRILAPAVAAILLLAAQACGSTPSGAPTGSPTPNGAGVVVSLTLTGTTVGAGTPIKATLVIDNRTGRTIKVGCGLKFAVGLTNAQFPFRPAFPAYCAANQSLPAGRTSYPTTIITTYQGCSETGRPDGGMPGCLPGRMGSGDGFTTPPPLPKGTYSTAVVINGLPSNLIHMPTPITVTLD